jgi:hypothetical protein
MKRPADAVLRTDADEISPGGGILTEQHERVKGGKE